MKRVVQSIATNREQFIKFPENADLQRTKGEFYRIAHCPNIVGAIDCTHIKIKNPGGEKLYTHTATRNTVERVFGMMKNKFRCFNGMQMKLDTAKAAIVAIAIMHNIILNDRLENEGILYY